MVLSIDCITSVVKLSAHNGQGKERHQMELFKRIFGRDVTDADAPGGKMKVLNRLLELKQGKSFEFDHAGVRFTVAHLDKLLYSVIDSFGRIHYRGPFVPSILTDVLALSKEQLAFTAKGQGSEADNFYEQGMRLVGLGDNQGALDAYRRALELFQRQSDDHSSAATWAKIGETYLYMRDHSEAEKALLKAADIFRRLGDSRALGGVLVNLGLATSALGDDEKARKLYIDAKNIAQRIGHKQLELVAQMNLERLQH